MVTNPRDDRQRQPTAGRRAAPQQPDGVVAVDPVAPLGSPLTSATVDGRPVAMSLEVDHGRPVYVLRAPAVDPP
jgi:hypothetical protein